MATSVELVPKGIKPVTLKNVVKFQGDLKARDKMLRLAQYATKVVVFRMLAEDPKSDLGKRIELLSKGIGLHRKAFKVGSWLDELQKLRELLSNGKSDLKNSLSVVLRSCMSVFVMLDNLVWLVSLKVVTGIEKDGLKLKAYRFRLTAAILNTVIGALDMQKQEAVVRKAAPEDRQKAAEKQGQLAVSMVKNVADVVTYMNSAKYIEAIFGSKLQDDKIGVIGSVSAAAALYGIWVKM